MAIGILGSGVSTLGVKYFLFDRPRVRMRASVDKRSEVRMLPVVEFTLTNVRKDEVHVTAIQVVRKPKEEGDEDTHAMLSAEPYKGKSFRLQGLEQVTFTANWEDIFPDGPDNGCGIDDVTAFYVEDIATEKRWKLPASDMRAIRKAIGPTLQHRREKATWSLTCRSCDAKTSWQARRPKPTGDGGFTYNFGFPEHEGWTEHEFHPFAIDGEGLCPKCSATSVADKPANETADVT